MAGFFGGETDRMREQAQACGRGGEQLTALVEIISGEIDGVTWQGPDAESFRELWHGALRSELLARGAEVQQRARELEAHAEEQDAASRDDGEFSEIIQDLQLAPFPGLGPLLPMPLPGFPGLLGHNGMLGGMLGGIVGGREGSQEFYGGSDYGAVGQSYGVARPIGDEIDAAASADHHLNSGRGSFDAYAGAKYSWGNDATTDSFGNTTETIGTRGSAEAGLTSQIDLPGGNGLEAGALVGAEAYAEAGWSHGPDGASGGLRAGAAVYGEQSATLTDPTGASLGMAQSYQVGAEAHANGHGHLTRGSEGQVNGVTGGFDAGAFAGAEISQTIDATAPGGWLSGSATITPLAGGGGSLAAGATVSTDDVSVSAGGKVAEAIGLGGSLTVGIHPNEIVQDISPGDYDLDDVISGASGAFRGATAAAGSTIGRINPFD